MIAAALVAGIFIGATAGFLLAAMLAATRVHRLTGQLTHWQRMAQRFVLTVREDQDAEEG